MSVRRWSGRLREIKRERETDGEEWVGESISQSMEVERRERDVTREKNGIGLARRRKMFSLSAELDPRLRKMALEKMRIQGALKSA